MKTLHAILSFLTPVAYVAAGFMFGRTISLALRWKTRLCRCTAVATATVVKKTRYGAPSWRNLYDTEYSVVLPGHGGQTGFIRRKRGRTVAGPIAQAFYYDPDQTERHYLESEKPTAASWFLRGTATAVAVIFAILCTACRTRLL